jgi:outer membrane protein X
MNFRLIALTLIASFFFSEVSAQEPNRARVGISIDAGRSFDIEKLSFGIGISIDPAYNISDHQIIGLSLGAFALAKTIDENALTSEGIGLTSLMGTYDHFILQNKKLAFSVGGGLGVFNIAHVYRSTSISSIRNNEETLFTGVKPGIMIRPGFEYGKFRLALEFNLIPSHDYSSNYYNFSGSNINSFFKWKMGVFIGGGQHNVKIQK